MLYNIRVQPGADDKFRARCLCRVCLLGGEDGARTDQHFGAGALHFTNRVGGTVGAEGDLGNRQTALRECLCKRSGILHPLDADDGDEGQGF